MNSEPHAPIAIFVYNRPEHTRKMFKSLSNNSLFLKSPIFIFCDAPKHPTHAEAVQEVRKIVKAIAPANAVIKEQKKNLGLANSIITGVTNLCNQYGKVIVIEDDLLLSPVCLEYFNAALEFYHDNPKVMHVAGYMYPTKGKLPNFFFYREATCWGWATWKRAWDLFEPNPKIPLDYIDKNNLRSEFDVNNSSFFYEMLLNQYNGKLDSWAIRWYSTIFMSKGLSLHTNKSYVHNIGNDGSGIHCGPTNEYDIKEVSLNNKFEFPEKVEEIEQAVQAMIAYRRFHSIPSLLRRITKKANSILKRIWKKI